MNNGEKGQGKEIGLSGSLTINLTKKDLTLGIKEVQNDRYNSQRHQPRCQVPLRLLGPLSLLLRYGVGVDPGNEVASVICLPEWIYPKNVITSENKL